MKRFLALTLALLLVLSLSFAFVGCDEPAPDSGNGTTTTTTTAGNQNPGQPSTPPAEELDPAEWAAATAIAAFANVSVRYTIETATYDSVDIAKFTADKVYRSCETVDKEGQRIDYMCLEVLFEGDAADEQKAAFLQLMLAVLADQANYTFDEETGVYSSSSVIETTLNMSDEETEARADETISDAEIKFKDGKIEYFKCHVVEKIYVNGQLVNTLDGDSVWTFSDYGTTVITESPDEVLGGN